VKLLCPVFFCNYVTKLTEEEHIVRCTPYLGGFIDDQDVFEPWIREQSNCWAEAVTDLVSVAQNFPQSAYSGLQKLLQQEWQFVQRVRKDIGMEFINGLGGRQSSIWRWIGYRRWIGYN
jgi:hypothetical protein